MDSLIVLTLKLPADGDVHLMHVSLGEASNRNVVERRLPRLGKPRYYFLVTSILSTTFLGPTRDVVGGRCLHDFVALFFFLYAPTCRRALLRHNPREGKYIVDKRQQALEGFRWSACPHIYGQHLNQVTPAPHPPHFLHVGECASIEKVRRYLSFL